MIRHLSLGFSALLCCVHLAAQSLPIWFWGEDTRVLMQDGSGNRKMIAEIPLSERFGVAISPHSVVTGMRQAQHGKEWHLLCSNSTALYYLYSADEGATWEKAELDHVRNHRLQAHDHATWAVKGEIAESDKYMGLNNLMDMVVDHMGNVHLVWEVDGANVFYDSEVMYAVKQGGVWKQQKVESTKGYPQGLVLGVALDVDAQQRPHVLISTYGKAIDGSQASIRLLSATTGTEWQEREVAATWAQLPALEFRIDGRGVFHAVTTVTDPAHEYAAMHWHSANQGKTWNSELIQYGNCRCDLETDALGGIHIAGTCYNDGVYYGEWKGSRWKLTELEGRAQMCHAKIFISPENVPGVAFFEDYGDASSLQWYRVTEQGWQKREVLHTLGGRSSSIQPVVAFIPDVQKNKPPSTRLEGQQTSEE